MPDAPRSAPTADTAAPPGLNTWVMWSVSFPRGSRPWLFTAAPPGLDATNRRLASPPESTNRGAAGIKRGRSLRVPPLAIHRRPSGAEIPPEILGLSFFAGSTIASIPPGLGESPCRNPSPPCTATSLHTKHREPLISRELQPRLFAYIGGGRRNEGNALLAAGGMPDHVQLLASLSRQTSVAEVVHLVKANSSGWVHQTFPELPGFSWQNGYGAFSVSTSACPP